MWETELWECLWECGKERVWEGEREIVLDCAKDSLLGGHEEQQERRWESLWACKSVLEWVSVWESLWEAPWV